MELTAHWNDETKAFYPRPNPGEPYEQAHCYGNNDEIIVLCNVVAQNHILCMQRSRDEDGVTSKIILRHSRGSVWKIFQLAIRR